MLQGEHSVILSTFKKLPLVIKIFILSFFEWPFYTGFTVLPSIVVHLKTFAPDAVNKCLNEVFL